MSNRRYNITSKTFTAQIAINDWGIVKEADPPVAYMCDRTERWVANLCRDRAWTIEKVQPEGDRVQS